MASEHIEAVSGISGVDQDWFNQADYQFDSFQAKQLQQTMKSMQQQVKADVSDQQDKPEAKTLKTTVNKFNQQLSNDNVETKFKIHKRTNRIYVQLVNQKTGKVIEEIPSSKMLDLIGHIWDEMGIMVNKKG
ncbi:MAG: flagellar protein FlaG [Liquorilactobacillus ghanensis]|uniref:flagellar protein FlaG n=1 Tax=Liquorilactobacillus ghanensis TaxID=399370 RepID=UPI0039EB7C8C